MIKTILLDFGGVISDDANAWEKMYKRIPELTGLSPNELDEIFINHWIDVSIGQKDLHHIFEDFINHSKNKITQDQLKNIYNEDTYIYQDIPDLLNMLRTKGIKIIILSNESKEGEQLRLSKIKDFVDKIYSSASLGLRKPDKKIYLKVLSDEDLDADEVVFIDDKERNINAAREIGIKSILYKNLKQLKKELQPYLN